MKYRLLGFVIVTALAGLSCTTTPAGTKAAAAGAEGAPPVMKETIPVVTTAGNAKMHCSSYRPTGSHRKKTRCITLEQKRSEEDAARMMLTKSNGSTLQSAEPAGP